MFDASILVHGLCGALLKESLAIWCDTASSHTEGVSSKLELHFNIWRDLPKGDDALDVGIRFKEVRPIKSLFLYIPSHVKISQIEDLSYILGNDKTVSAVFNDTLAIGAKSISDYEVINSSTGMISLRVVHINSSKHIKTIDIKEPGGTLGTVIEFTSELFHSLTEAGDYYLRFRITLAGALKRLFVDDYPQEDRAFHAAFSRTDIIEFRVNERRNFGEELRRQFPKMEFPTIVAIHYVLICDTASELVQSHAAVHKMRRLESNLWTSYLNHFGQVDASRMMIYHWRSLAKPDKAIDDFLILSIFRKNLINPAILVASAIILLGAVGSTIQSFLTYFLPYIFSSLQNPWKVQAIIFGFLALLVVIILAALRSKKLPTFYRRARFSVVEFWKKTRGRFT